MGARFRRQWWPLTLGISIAVQLAAGGAVAQERDSPAPASSGPRDWALSVFVGYGTRTLDGSLVIDSLGPERGAATARSLGLGNAENAQVAIDGRWQRLHVGLAYLPTTVTGQGFALATLELGGISIGVNTPTSTQVDVNLGLLTADYAVVQTGDTTLGIGLGLGRTSVDVAITPDVGQSLAIRTDTPFGFLAVGLDQQLAARWSMSCAAHGLSLSTNGDEIDYYDFNFAGAYRALDRSVTLDVVAGFRLINFGFDFAEAGGSVALDIQLRGPYLGLRVAF